MARSFIPARDADLALFLANFATLLTATPTAFGVTAPDAATNQGFNDAFQAALVTANDPATRTTPTIAAKDSAKAAAVSFCRTLAQQIQAFPTITDEQLANLGLTVRQTGRTPTPPPATYPLLGIVQQAAHACIMTIADQNTPAGRARPQGYAGCELYVSYGAVAPVSLAGMSYVGLQTRFAFNWDLGSANVGQRAWLIGRWINRSGESGPTSAPVSLIVPA
jgi:hypothetical protein